MESAEAMARDLQNLRKDCVLRDIIDHRAAESPDKVFAIFENGSQWTFATLRTKVRRVAAGLHACGVKPGDVVAGWLPNGPDALSVWFGVNYLGAIYAPINIAMRGKVLANIINNSGARLMIADATLIERLNDVDTGDLQRIIAVGTPTGHTPPALEIVDSSILDQADDSGLPDVSIEPWDTQLIIYTSGTTGPSKGVMTSSLHLRATATSFLYLRSDDRGLLSLPLFHVSGIGLAYRLLRIGGSCAVTDSFRTQTFWESVRRYNITTMTLLGAMAEFLLKTPVASEDANNPLRAINIVPFGRIAKEFGRRFGVDVYTSFNMTEVSNPIVSGLNPDAEGTCGRARDGVEARIVDENDFEVPIGTVGELVVRSDAPWTMTSGYFRDPEATARAWRNGWFHTGDGFRCDEAGNFYFVDRLKDAIRRRGENISTFEAEGAICEHPDVREAAVVGVPGAGGESDVLAVLAPVEGMEIDPVEMIEFLRPRMPHFMIPRYIRILAELPKTSSQKVQKHLLRDAAITPDTWDREAAGIEVKRERLMAREEQG